MKDYRDFIMIFFSCIDRAILDDLNSLYKSKNNSVDMNLTFTLATTDKNGETLPNPGVEYIQWPESYPIDCEALSSIWDKRLEFTFCREFLSSLYNT